MHLKSVLALIFALIILKFSKPKETFVRWILINNDILFQSY